MQQFSLLSGTSNLKLASAVAQKLQLKLTEVEITRFIDNECRVYVKEDLAGQQVFVLQSLSTIADQHLVELSLLGQAAKSLGAREIIAVIPWMGYSKQDKAFRRGEAVSAQMVAQIIEGSGFNRVITCELHSENLLPFFHIGVTELSTHELLLETLKKKSGKALEKLLVVSPDRGGRSRSERFAKTADLPIVYLDKTRDKGTGRVEITGISDQVAGKQIVIFDDIINTGATAIKSAQFLKKLAAGPIWFLATHGVLAGDAASKLEDSPIDQVIITDTIALCEAKKFSKLTQISIASLLSKAIDSGIN